MRNIKEKNPKWNGSYQRLEWEVGDGSKEETKKKERKEENKKEGKQVVDCQGLGEEVWGVTVLQDEKSSEEG